MQCGADWHGDQVLLRHPCGNGLVELGLEAQVAIGENAHQLAVFHDGHARNPVVLHHLERLGDLLIGSHRDRVHNHAAFTALDPVDLLRLSLNGHVPMDDADAALLRQRDRQVRLGDGIHRRARNRNIQRDVT